MDGVQSISSTLEVIGSGKDVYSVMGDDFDVTGEYLELGEYLSGEPECMVNMQMEVEAPVVNILFEISTNGGTAPRYIINRGAAILRVAQMIENSGQRVCIYGSNFSKAGTEFHGQIICLKHADQNFDLHSLSYALVHPSMLRRHTFRCTEGLPEEHASKYEHGYGRSMGLREIEDLGDSIMDVDLYIDVLDNSSFYRTPEQAIEHVKSMAVEQGVIRA